MNWYIILFIISISIFLLKALTFWALGERGIERDTSYFSFNGLIFFMIGFSGHLTMTEKFDTTNFSFITYLGAIFIGFLACILLFELRNLILKIDTFSAENFDLTGYKGKILKNLGEGYYKVRIHTSSGFIHRIMPAKDYNSSLEVGTNGIVISSDFYEYMFKKL